MNIRTLGTLCMLGALFKIGSSVASEIVDASTTVYDPIWALHLIFLPLLFAGPLALQRMGAFGSGRTARLGQVGTGLVALGLAGLMLSTVVYLSTHVFSPVLGGVPAIMAGTGILLLGIAVVAARRLHGWHAWMPLLAGIVYFAQLVPQAMMGLGQGQRMPVGSLIVFWWIAWFLMGYSVFAQHSEPQTAAA